MRRLAALCGIMATVLWAFCALTGCEKTGQRVVVRGGPSLLDVFTYVGAEYEKSHPDVDIVPEFNGPICVLPSIEGAAGHIDVIVATGSRDIARFKETDTTAFSEPIAFGTARLALAAPSGRTADIRGLGDLLTDEVRFVGVSDPDETDLGRATKQAMEKAGIWDELQTAGEDGESKLKVAGTGCKLLQWLQLRECDAAIVFDFCVSGANPPARLVDTLPESTYEPVTLMLGINERSGAHEQARRFADFVTGEDGIRILGEAGIAPLEEMN